LHAPVLFDVGCLIPCIEFVRNDFVEHLMISTISYLDGDWNDWRAVHVQCATLHLPGTILQKVHNASFNRQPGQPQNQ
jgi:hypothetical protein